MKLVKTEDAVGQVLCHDITRIVRGVVKDAAFRKGHVVTEEDIPLLLQLGKDHLYIWENDESMMHENDAAEVLRKISMGLNMHPSSVKEGKIELISDTKGIFLVDIERLRALNALGEIMIATIASGFTVEKGQRLAGMRVIPLLIEKEKMEEAKRTAGAEPLMDVIPFALKTFGVVTTGNEVYNKRIEDTFTPVLVDKMKEYGAQMIAHEVSDDDNTHIEAAIRKVADSGADLILCTGGMSVDPDDRTPLAIRNTGAKIVSYGAPVLPGAMFLMGYLPDGRPICGIPGCAMYSKRTILDLVLPYIMAGIEVTAHFLAGLGHGGFCQGCKDCRFPVCPFGKGV